MKEFDFTMLINREHPLYRSISPGLLVPADPARPKVLLHWQAADMLGRLFTAVDAWGQVVPVSGWRSHEEQIALYQSTLAQRGRAFTETYVAWPGCSEHESGLAVDLGENLPGLDPICPSFPDGGVCALLRARAPEFGFILRYPKGKESVTGIGWEPWHFRYVGRGPALEMEREGLTLEEYAAQALRRAQ